MTDTNETIADIIAEKRRQADEIERDVAEKMKRGEMISDCYARELVADIRREADRLEAAHKRERGDCAKLREALIQCELFLGYVDRHGHPTLNPGDKCVACEDASKLRDMVNRALSAPPRNCDRFKTAAEAIDAYQDLTGDQLATDSGMEEWVVFAVWLFVPATEKEGGNDAD